MQPHTSTDLAGRALSALLLLLCAACNPNDAVPETATGDDTKQRAIGARAVVPRSDTAPTIREPEQDAEAQPDLGPTWAYNLCTEVYACAQASCGTSVIKGCEGACAAKADPVAAAGFDDYADCMDDICRAVVCSADQSAVCIAQCAAQRCASMLLPCLASGKTGSNGCSVLFMAQDGCAKAQDSFKCLAGGYDTLKADQQAAWLAMNKCLAGSVAADRWNDCLPFVLACAADGKVGPKPCRDIMACEGACGSASHLYLCAGKCMAAGTAAAQADFLTVRKCVYAAETGKADDGQCFSSVAACAEPTGMASCAQTWDCTNKCKGSSGKAELYCVTSCLHQASKAASEVFTAWWGCREGVCKPKCGTDKTCLLGCYQKSCGTLSKACLIP